MHKPFFIFLLLYFQITFGLTSKSLPTKWTVESPFEQKVFIENKGQYNLKHVFPSSLPVLYSSQQDGMEYFFTKNAIYIKHTKYEKRSEKEIKAEMKRLGIKEEHKEEEEGKEFSHKAIDEYSQIEYFESSCSAIINEDQVFQMYNFCIDSKNTLGAHGYKKIIYKNLYPGIDMEFFFPEDKQGFKYNFIIHPNANILNIKIKYPLAKKIKLDNDGNLTIKSLFGLFTDHMPVANEVESFKTVACSFVLKNNEVRFNIGEYDKSKKLIIDPWTTTPIFTGGNKAFDVDWDNAGNCYAYGGQPPFKLIKFNSAGVQLWSYTTTFSGSLNGNIYYGDFAVDRKSQSVYITEGVNPSTGANIQKINQAGLLVANFPGNPNFYEMWRIAFSRCTNQAVIAGGGWTSIPYTGVYLDTNLTNISPVNVLNTTNLQHDMWGLALDNNGNCYMGTAQSYPNPSYFNNLLLKLPLPSLAPTTWSVSTGYLFNEVASISYYTNTYSGFPNYSNGLNGITTSDNYVYTYDSYVLKKWNITNGALANSLNINGSSQSTMSYGGISADACDNVFLGLNNSIKQYNSSMTLVNSISTPGTVYDVNLANNNMLYVCGNGFVSALQINITPCSNGLQSTMQVNNPGCGMANGTATVSVTGGTPPYTVTWNTTPVQSGTVAINLGAGTYVATIIDNSCKQLLIYDTVKVAPSPGSFTLNTTSQSNSCYNFNNGSATVNIVGGTGPFGIAWSNGQMGLKDSLLSAGTYTVHVTDLTTNCSDTATVSITQPSKLTVNVQSGQICAGQSYTINAIVSGGTSPYSYNWNNGFSNSNPLVVNPSTTSTYSVLITDDNGCTAIDSAILVTVSPPLHVIISDTEICSGNSIVLNAVASGGNGTYIYNWLPGNLSGNNISVSPTITTIFTVTINDGCTTIAATDTGIVFINSFTVNTTSQSINCFGENTGSATISIAGAAGPFGISWSNGQNGLKDSLLSAGTYTASISDLTTTCTNTTSVLIVQPTNLSVSVTSGTICQGQTFTLNAQVSGGTLPYTYNWNNGISNANPYVVSTASTYTLMVSDANNCKITDSLIHVSAYPPLQVILGDTGICAGNSINLTVNATGGNGSYIYNWMPGNLSGNSITISPSSTTIYSITVNDGCTTNPAIDTGIVNVVSPPSITMPNAVDSCAPLCVNFINPASLINWQWDFGDGTTSYFKNPIHCYTKSGTFYPSITYTANTGCISKTISTNTITVFAASHTQFLASPNPTNILSPEVFFTNQFINSNNLQWNFGDGASSNIQNPSHTYSQPGVYNVTLITQNKIGCNDTVTEQIIINDIFTFYAPDGFTPNGDLFNEKFLPIGEGWDNSTFKLWIFDRWGNLIFKTQDPFKGWDGKINEKGSIVQEDTYVWKIQLNDISHKFHQFSGTVTLIK